MNWTLVTQVIVAVSFFVLLAYDVVALWKGGPPATISHVVRCWIVDNPILAFALGVLVGHVLWRD